MLSVVKIYTASWFDKRMSMKCWWRVTGRRKTKVLREKPVQVPPGLPQHLHIVKCLFKCVTSKCSQLSRFTQHHGSINEWVLSVGGKLLAGEKPKVSEKSLSKCQLVYWNTCT